MNKRKKRYTVKVKPIIRDESQYIEFNNKRFMCAFAGYINPIQKKWGFLIGGDNSGIFSGMDFTFLGTSFRTTYTLRRSVTNSWLSSHDTETYIQAWVL